MNIGLNNRKKLSNEFSEFIESIMLEPKLIEDILKGEINEEYVNKKWIKLNISIIWCMTQYSSIINKIIFTLFKLVKMVKIKIKLS